MVDLVVVLVMVSNSSSKRGGYSCRKTGCYLCTGKPVKTATPKRDQKLGFKLNYCLEQLKSITECSK